jgi:hypothetical protein
MKNLYELSTIAIGGDLALVPVTLNFSPEWPRANGLGSEIVLPEFEQGISLTKG